MQRPIEILEKYRLNFQINEDQPASEMLIYKEKISTFSAFLTKAFVQLEVSNPSIRIHFSRNLSNDQSLSILFNFVEISRIIPQILCGL